MPDTMISEAMQEAVGREISRRVSYPVSTSDIRRWAIAVYYPQEPPRRYLDGDLAQRTPWAGIVAPEDFNPFAWAVAETVSPDVEVPEENRAERSELALGIAGPDLKFRLNGGISVRYGVPMRPADVITSVTCLAGYVERPGRLGLMLFTTTEDVWTNQNAELVKTTRNTLIRY